MSCLERPVFILAPPRSGSTLLFETLCQSQALWSLGDEAHGIIERHSQLQPGQHSTGSNRLLQSDYTVALGEIIRKDFLRLGRDCQARPVAAPGTSDLRLLEKTPKNVLRIPFLLELFPDAQFIYLYRDARDNISSIIDGWRSGRFVTYPDRQTPHGQWSFLLPPGWQKQRGQTLAGIAAFQWAACHDYLMRDLAAIEPGRWCAVNYAELVSDTEQVVTRLCHFMQVAPDERLLSHCRHKLPPSRYTLSPPAHGKWHRHAREIAPEMAAASAIAVRVNAFTKGQSTALDTDLAIDLAAFPAQGRVGRNESCPCGSAKKYKHCHGQL